MKHNCATRIAVHLNKQTKIPQLKKLNSKQKPQEVGRRSTALKHSHRSELTSDSSPEQRLKDELGRDQRQNCQSLSLPALMVWRLGSLEVLHGAPQVIPKHQVLLFSYLHKKASPAVSICCLPFGGQQYREAEYTMSTHYVSQQTPGFYRFPFQHQIKKILFL